MGVSPSLILCFGPGMTKGFWHSWLAHIRWHAGYINSRHGSSGSDCAELATDLASIFAVTTSGYVEGANLVFLYHTWTLPTSKRIIVPWAARRKLSTLRKDNVTSIKHNRLGHSNNLWILRQGKSHHGHSVSSISLQLILQLQFQSTERPITFWATFNAQRVSLTSKELLSNV